MKNLLIKLNGITLHVFYDCDVIHDPWGTGDSPINYEIELYEIEIEGSDTNILNLLSTRIIDLIEDEIIKYEY